MTAAASPRVWLAAAMLLPPFAWVTYQWGLGYALRPACGVVGDWLGVAGGASGLLICCLGLLAAVRCLRLSRNKGRPGVVAWLAKGSMLGSAIFGLPIAFQTLATLVVPSCAQ